MLRAGELKEGDIVGLFYREDDTSIWPLSVVTEVSRCNDGSWYVGTLEIDGTFHTGGIADSGYGLETFNNNRTYYKKVGHTDLLDNFLKTLERDNSWKKEGEDA